MEGQAFSKTFSHIKLVKKIEEDKIESIRSIWKDDYSYYAFFISSGLRAITNRLANEILTK